MKTLSPTLTYGIVGDVHQQIPTLKRLVNAHHAAVDHWIFLGDWFDDFVPETTTTETAEWLKSLLSTDIATCLWGNHDLSYKFEWARCSGWTWVKQCIIENAKVPWERFHLAASIAPEGQAPWLFSHAGVTRELYLASPNLLDLTIDLLEAEHCIHEGKPHSLLLAGKDRGGSEYVGGCVWQDWNSHIPIEGVRQVVGHTPADTTRTRSWDYCIDTRLKEFGIWKNGELEIIKV